MSASVKKTLENGYFIDLDFHLWSGAKRLKAEDLGLNELPTELVSLGTKRIFPRDRIRRFQSLKRRAERALDAIGIRFLKGWFVPDVRIDEVTKRLDEICREFDDLKADTRADYDDVLKDFVDQHPQHAELIERAAEPASVIDHRLTASYNVIAVKGLCPEYGDHNGATRQAKGLRARLYREVATAAEEAWESMKDRDWVNAQSLSRIRLIRKKLDGLKFLDKSFQGVVRAIDEVLAKQPQEGSIRDTALVGLKSLVMLLRDPASARELGLNKRQVSWTESAMADKPDASEDQQHTEANAQADSGQQEAFREETESVEPSHERREDASKDESEAPAPVHRGQQGASQPSKPLGGLAW